MGFWWSSSVKPIDYSEFEKMSPHREELKQKILECFDKQTLLQHLQDPDGWKAFHEFMESEYCGENTRFWQAVEELRQLQDDSKVEATVKQVYGQYFGEMATEPVNLPNVIVQGIKKNFTRNIFDIAQKRVVSLMEGSQWHRYPSSTFFNLWVEAKLTNPDSIIMAEESGRSSEDKPKFSESEVRERVLSALRSKPLKDFLYDPNGYRCFETYLQTSKLGMEYFEYLIFWMDVEGFKDHPTQNSASKIYNKHFINPDSKEEESLIQLPELMLISVKDAIANNTVKKEIFNDIQSHLTNKLKKDAFDIKFWMSEVFANYLNTLVQQELALLKDVHECDSKEWRLMFDMGKPSDKGLDNAGFQTVISYILEKIFNAKWKHKNRFQKWASGLFQQFGVSNPGYLTFSEFLIFYKALLENPNIPYQQIETQDKTESTTN